MAAEVRLNPWHLPRATSLPQFATLERQTHYLGLSDEARTDVFRRFNPHLSHEQVRQSHELTEDRVAKHLDKLRKGVAEITKAEVKSAVAARHQCFPKCPFYPFLSFFLFFPPSFFAPPLVFWTM
jgi:hypothetical protein